MQNPIKSRGLKPEKVSNEEWQKLDERDASTIRLWVDDSIYHLVANEPSSWVVWRTPEDLYEKDTIENNMYVIRQLVNLKE